MVPSCFLITLSQRLLKPNKMVQQSLQILLLFISDFIKPSLRQALLINNNNNNTRTTTKYRKKKLMAVGSVTKDITERSCTLYLILMK